MNLKLFDKHSVSISHRENLDDSVGTVTNTTEKFEAIMFKKRKLNWHVGYYVFSSI